MTLETSLTKARYLGNGSAREWPLPFPVLRPEHVHLVVTDTATGQDTPVSSGYTVTGCGTQNVSVVYPVSGASLPAGQKLTIYRTVPYVQQLDLENGGAFDAEVIEGQFDNTVMQIQQLSEEISRAVKISITSDEKPLTAEEIYEQVNRIADRAEDAVGRAGEAVVQAENAADRAESAAETASGRANELQNLSIAVDDAPHGHVASGSYNPTTGMLTLRVPQGPQGERGEDGQDGTDGKDGRDGKDGEQGASGVVLDVRTGMFALQVVGADLILFHDDADAPPNFTIDAAGNLIWEQA